MRRYIYIISVLILAISACQKVEFNTKNDGKVDLCFDIEVPQTGTKALAETATLNSVHVAIFDASGYKVDFVEAEIVGKKDAKTYTYAVRVTSTEEPRTLHFLGNCPADKAEELKTAYGNEMTLISGIVCNDEAYWQRKVLSKGIPAEIEAAKSALGTVELVRNFGKLIVEDNSANFTLKGFYLYNVPDRAFIAPYINSGSNAGKFVENYAGKEYKAITPTYPGYMPSDAVLLDPVDYKVQDGAVSAYLFETPVSTEVPFVVIYGNYMSESDLCYYRVNLKDADGRDYPLLRNFNFYVSLSNIISPGESTLQAAIDSPGSGDISTNTSFINATNISDAQSQLFVDKTSVTVVSKSTITIRYKFIPDLEEASTTINNNVRTDPTDNSKPIEIIEGEVGEYGAAIESYDVSTVDKDGFRTITIETTDQDGKFKEQSITVVAHGKDKNGNYEGGIISRSITIAVRPKFKLTVDCPQIVKGTEGAALPVRIGLESDIPASLFPINVSIEATALTLAPRADENLPVTTGKSLSGSNKPAYQFVKAVSYAEYTAAMDNAYVKDEITYYPVVCNFVSNTANSASAVWVDSELFNTANCSFVVGKEFSDVSLTSALVGIGKEVTLSFKTPGTEKVIITFVGALKGGNSVYEYTPTSAGVQTVTGIIANTTGKAVSVTLSNPLYFDGTAKAYRSATLKAGALTSSGLPAAPENITSGKSKDFTMIVNGQSVLFNGRNTSGVYSLTGPNANTTVTFTEDVTADTVVPMSYTYNSKTATCNSMTVDQIVTDTVGEVVFTL